MIPPHLPTPGPLAASTSESVAAWCAAAVQVLAVVGVVALSIAVLLCLFRLLRGPHLADRASALDAIGVQFIGLVILLTILNDTLLYVDGILVLALLSFAGTVAAAQFIAQPHIVRRAAESDPPPEGEPPPTHPPHPPADESHSAEER